MSAGKLGSGESSSGETSSSELGSARGYFVVIPARYESQRLPGKALSDIGGKTLIQRVWERAIASTARQVVIATDDKRIVQAAEAFGARAIMTSRDHASGSDRIAECADRMAWPETEIIVNLQGDEPLMPPECIEQVAALLASDRSADAASLFWPIDDESEAADPNVVKVVLDQQSRALMFSRSLLPQHRDYVTTAQAMAAGLTWRRHLGLYAYRVGSLRRFTQTAATPLEQCERLEQLRYLETGGTILMEQACLHIPPGVDTPEDLERVRKSISR